MISALRGTPGRLYGLTPECSTGLGTGTEGEKPLTCLRIRPER